MSPERWLILADDLTGAADTAIAFTRRGWKASVGWGGAALEDEVIAIDAETRDITDPQAAAARHLALLRAHRPGRNRLFKKIDSTLRGHPAAELHASMGALGLSALIAPAFPSQGRTTLGGRVALYGLPLEGTTLWARDHTYPNADLRDIFGQGGAPLRHATMEALHDGALPGLLEATLAGGPALLVCDAMEERDLALIAQAAMPHAERLLWVGTAGLAHAIAALGPHQGAPPPMPPIQGGILVVVGSRAEVSQAGVARLAHDPELRGVVVSSAMLRAGLDAWRGTRQSVRESLARGQDVMVTLTGLGDLDPALSRHLGALLLDAEPGGLIVTGGATALALLGALGQTSMQMLDEVEPGVPVGMAGALPVITKAGAFGDSGTLGRCLARMRQLRAKEMSR